MMAFPSLAAVLSTILLAGNVAALDPIVVKGTKFFYENGTQFYMKGVAYQQDAAAGGEGVTKENFADPLANPAACRRDIPKLVQLGTNTIRTYAINAKADHSECMRLLQDAGIYVISDLGEPRLSINRKEPQWNTEVFQRYKDVIDELSQYSNVIGFFAGNEVSNDRTNTPASGYVKAAVRDTKKHIKDTKTRPLYVGYAANDDADIRIDIAHYFNCGEPEEAIDFWGYNIYQWCGENTIQGSGYADQIEFFRNYSVPVFFAEYGCNQNGGADARIFQETEALYTDQMTEVFSGGIVYMYFQEANDYGLVELQGSEVKTMKNFDALSSRIAGVNPSSTAMSSYNPTNAPAACPGISGTWKATNNLPPTPDKQTCECMVATLGCVATAGLDKDDYADLFGFVCGTAGRPCAGINSNVTTGVHGAYSMCSDEQKLSYVLDRYYKNQKREAGACDFEGKATIKSPTSVNADCQKRLESASAVNDVAATATAAPGGGAGDDDSAAPGTRRLDKVFSIGDFAIGAYLVAAVGVGAGMVLI